MTLRAVVVAIHDVAPRTLSTCQRLAERLDAAGVGPLALLVVPAFHGDAPIDAAGEAARWLRARAARGDEVVLHGYHHLADHRPRRLADRLRARILTDGEEEFLALPEHEAARRLAAGLDVLATAGLGRPRGFVAPAWLLGEPARRAAAALGFAYTTTRGAVHDLARGVAYPAPVVGVSSRSRTRTVASRAIVPWLWRRVRPSPLVRFAFHPADARAPEALRLLERLLADALARRRLLTYGAAVEACRAAGGGGQSAGSGGAPPGSPGVRPSPGTGEPGMA